MMRARCDSVRKRAKWQNEELKLANTKVHKYTNTQGVASAPGVREQHTPRNAINARDREIGIPRRSIVAGAGRPGWTRVARGNSGTKTNPGVTVRPNRQKLLRIRQKLSHPVDKSTG